MRRLSLVLALLLTSCSLLVDLSGLDGAGADGSAFDGATESGSVLVNGDFENSVGGCSPGWTTINASMTTVDAAHSGASSCEVCVTTPGTPSYLKATPPLKNPPLGSQYFVQAFVMIEPDASLSSAYLYVSENISGGSKSRGSAQANLSSTAWQNLDTTTTPFDDAGTGLEYNVVLTTADGGGGCVLVDDARMVPLP